MVRALLFFGLVFLGLGCFVSTPVRLGTPVTDSNGGVWFVGADDYWSRAVLYCRAVDGKPVCNAALIDSRLVGDSLK